ncbi:MAG: hypothetical protein E7661_03990 [Ruminococcaceae bacterium]|nr:hypothetical protein [Oscillospiraceae bacterium]
MKQNLPEAHDHTTDAPRADLRLPLVICAVEGSILLLVYTLLVYYKIPHPLITGLCFAGIYALSAIILFSVYALRLSKIHRDMALSDQVNSDIYRIFRNTVDIPYAVMNSDGRIRVINTALKDILRFRSPVCNIPLGEICPGLTMEKLMAYAGQANMLPLHHPEKLSEPTAHVTESSDLPVVRLSDERRYKVEPYAFLRRGERYYFLLFRDTNDYLDLVEKTNREHMVLAYIVLDNLQELTQFVRANYRATANEIESALSDWVGGMNGMLREYDRDKYMALFSEEKLDECIKDGFSILDKIMSIRVGDNSFPVSISMGIADIDGTMQERDKVANNALDMALQRGGNQVALIRRNSPGVSYFGGTHKTMESNTSISSRVSASLLEKRLSQCDRVLIMSHSNPDFDAIGSTVGAYRLSRSILAAGGHGAVPVNIVMNLTCETFKICARHLSAVPEYEQVFIDKNEARGLVTPHTVLIVTDVNNPAIFEAPELIQSIPARDGVSSIAVIDHHRLVGALPFVPFLHYIEATKSSASEIVGEILEQSAYADTLLKEEANMLLAGIMLDTHNFTRSAGAQTFEVTYYLYSRNAHTGTTREFFNERFEELQVASDFDSHARIYDDIFAITWLSDDHIPSPDDRIAASKAADKLLGIQGVEASFALAIVGKNVIISGRSKGKINVQLILEKLEGGGHFDMAGAQVADASIPQVYEMLKEAIDEYMAERSFK